VPKKKKKADPHPVSIAAGVQSIQGYNQRRKDILDALYGGKKKKDKKP
jgi:hypothetical protein